MLERIVEAFCTYLDQWIEYRSDDLDIVFICMLRALESNP